MANTTQLLDKFVGGSEKAIRDIFAKARAAAPSIIFFVRHFNSILSPLTHLNHSLTG